MKIKELRKRIGLKQDEVATKLGLNVRTYQNYELGRRQPDLKTVIQIADFFNVSLDELLERENCKFINLNLIDDNKKNVVEMVMKLNKENLNSVEAYTLAKLEEQNK